MIPPRHCPRTFLCGGFFLCVLAFAAKAGATPWTPADDAVVLEQLPSGSPPAPPTALDADAAARAAREYIERARRDGDPRFLGYADGVLRPWHDHALPPPAVLLLRATLRQSQHRFDEALRDLGRLLLQQPDNAQALLTRATVLKVLGRYAEAAADCQGLRGLAEPLIAIVCEQSVRSLRGELASAAEALASVERAGATQPAGVRAWYFAERGEMAERLGDDDAALAHYRRALAGRAADPPLRAAAADVLIRRGQPREALAVIGEAPAADMLRLRRALALRALGVPDEQLERTLADAFAATRRRGEAGHLREEAIYVLRIVGDAGAALPLALRNWQLQREPADALLLAQAAHAAGRPEAAAPLRAWLRANGLQDERMPR